MTDAEIVEGLGSVDAETRRQAVAAAAHAADIGIKLAVVEALGDVDWRVRAEATRTLCSAPQPSNVTKRLVEVLVSGTDIGFRNAAVEALGGGGENSVMAIQARLRELDADGRKLAAEALAKIASSTALIPLELLAADVDINVQAAAIEAVAAVGRSAPERAFPILDQAFVSSAPFVRLVALDAVRRLGLVLPWPMLRRLLDDPTLTVTGLQLVANISRAEAAPYFVRGLEESVGHTWGLVLSCTRQFAEQSLENRVAVRRALAGLSIAAEERLTLAAGGEGTTATDALTVLALRGGAVALELTLSLLGVDDRTEVLRACAAIFGADALDGLARRLAHEQPTVRAHAVELLACLGEEESLRPRLLRTLRGCAADPSTSVVRAWLRAITLWGEAEDLEVAFASLEGAPHPAVWRAALPALEASARRFPVLARTLALGVSPRDPLAASAAAIIAALDSPVSGSEAEDVEWLIQALSNESATARVAAIDALSTLPSAAATEALLFALTDDASEVQLAAVRALGAAAATETAPRARLVQLAKTSSNVGLVVAALQSLGASREPELLGPLQTLLESPDGWRAAAAVTALSGYKPVARATALRRALRHQDSEVVKCALEAFEPDQRALDDFILCLNHPAWDVRRVAADQLGKLRSDAAGTALKDRLSDEREPLVVSAIYRGLSQLAEHISVQWSMLPPESGLDR
jgi:HEAT repeat protein